MPQCPAGTSTAIGFFFLFSFLYLCCTYNFCAVAHLTGHFKRSSLALWISSLQAKRVNNSDIVEYGIYADCVLPEGNDWFLGNVFPYLLKILL